MPEFAIFFGLLCSLGLALYFHDEARIQKDSRFDKFSIVCMLMGIVFLVYMVVLL